MNYSDKKSQALSRGIPFSLSKSVFNNLINQTHCFYSGLPFDDSNNYQLSLERIDNNLGYVDGNVIAVCKIINNAKSNMTTESQIDEMLEYYKNEIDKNLKKLEKLNCIESRLESIIEDWYKNNNKSVKTPFDFELSKRTNVNKRKSIKCRNDNYAELILALPYAKDGIKKLNNLSDLDKLNIKLGLSLN